MVDSHCEILWGDNSGAGLGLYPTASYGSGLDDPTNQAVTAQQRLRSKMVVLWINNYFTTDYKLKLRDSRYLYTFNTQYYGAAMLFVIVKLVQPYTHARCSDIKYKLENMKMYQFKHGIPRSNLQIVSWMNEISISRETY